MHHLSAMPQACPHADLCNAAKEAHRARQLPALDWLSLTVPACAWLADVVNTTAQSIQGSRD